MNAIEDTQDRRSIVSDTLQKLEEKARRLREKINLLEAGQQVDRSDVSTELTELLDLSQNLRDAISSEDSGAQWRSKEELHALVTRLDEVAVRRQRYLDLVQRLESGTVTHRRERTREERLQERDAAVAELLEISAQPIVPELPGPEASEWLEWACSLDDSTQDPNLKLLKMFFPRLDDFVRQMEIEMWHDGEVEREDAKAAEPAGIHVVSQQEAAVSVAVAEPIVQAPASHPEPEAKAEELEELGPMKFVTATELMEEPTHPEPSGERGFLPADEVECLALYQKKARREPKATRAVRALVAVSHWLTPWDQNPLLYPGGGVAAEIGYMGAEALEPMSAVQAQMVVTAADDLLLLTGGADLLRWSLENAEHQRADAVAAVRRLNEQQLRKWFGEVFKIELAEPQVKDMYRLTFGIPLLVGELHRRVVPLHDSPPTWLGFAIWTRVKETFEAQLPVLAQDLKNGHAAVKLTERERAILKMVVLASDNSTEETLAANLMENWHSYKHPELAPLSSADETSVRLLQMLGLLPTREEWEARPLKALAPVDADDPIRQIVSYL